ncbi:MAG: chemotaxis protein CheB, partial [Candidatus Binataceae bacterium]
MADDPVGSGTALENPAKEFYVVGIGASAGGVSALRQFFSRIAPDSGMAFVVILHLSPQHESSLPALIQSQTLIPVTQVTEAVAIEPNHVYVIPPSKYLALMDGKIRLTEPEREHGAHTSIDLFFRTLADAYGKDAIAIILSGTGADGTLGIGRVKEHGGLVIAQDPAEAEYVDMPRSAIGTALVDFILPVAEIPDKLRAMRDNANPLRLGLERPETEGGLRPELSGALRDALTIMRLRTGNDFSHYKRPTLLRRISRRIQVHDLADLPAYLNFIREHSEEVTALLRDLLITVTNVFRDPEAFELLQKEVVPKLFAGKSGNDQVRVWSAGCATGEEAYSIAILLAEYAARLPDPPRIQVFATDIDEKAIAQAREGRYLATISVDVSPERLRQFFVKEGAGYQIKKDLREIVLFARHNVVRDPPFSRLDLVSCRNLLIYLNREMQERLLSIFHFALRPDGYLFLGASESAEITPALFATLDKKRCIYSRRATVGPIQPAFESPLGVWQARMPVTGGREESPVSAGELHEEVVERLAPPSVLINEDYDVIHISANAGRYMRMAGGEPTRNLLALIHPYLHLELRAALLEAKMRDQFDAAPKSRSVRVSLGGEARAVSLGVRRVGQNPEAARGFFLVTFDESPTVPRAAEPAAHGTDELEIVPHLEQELRHARDQLRITVEQYETSTEELRASNEELQAINEELRSASEELETSKEELQSVNEELTTVNQEYKGTVEEVRQANSDLRNLMASTDIATIFLDRALRIRRYTTRAEQLFNITAEDLGRPLEHFTNKLDYPSLTAEMEQVLRTLQVAQREVHSSDGNWYIARLSPYRTLDDQIDGVVLTFVDITNRREAEQEFRRQTAIVREQGEILNFAHVLIRDINDRIVYWNAGCERLYGYTGEEALGRLSHELLKTESPIPLAEIDAHLRKTGQWEGELVHTTRAGTKIIVASHWVLHHREQGEQVVLEVNNDVTARRLAEEALREADRNKDHFLAMLAHELRNPLGAMLSSIEVLRRENHGPPAVDQAQEVIHRQFQHLLRLVDDLLDIERLTHGKITINRQQLRLADVVGSTLETCQPLIDSSTHEFTVSIPEEPIYLNGDLMRLSQVLSNLLNNAFKYTPAGGKIHLNAAREDGGIVIRLRDSGNGVSPEMLPRLFDMYSQGEPLSQAGAKGLGLGLALVRQLVAMHDGIVEVFSEGLGKGSEFIIRLPSIPAPNLTQGIMSSDGAAAEAPTPANKKVVIIDDNRDGADALAFLLESDGYDVRIAYDGPAGIGIANEFKPEIAIIDIGLPEMDGYEVARRMRELLPEALLLALSGWRIDRRHGRARDSKFDHFLRKPIEVKELAKLIAQSHA